MNGAKIILSRWPQTVFHFATGKKRWMRRGGSMYCIVEIGDRGRMRLSEDLVVIPLPTSAGTITYAVARLVIEGDGVFAEAIIAVPDTVFAPPRRIALSPHSLAQLRPGSSHRPGLYLYEGMILPPP